MALVGRIRLRSLILIATVPSVAHAAVEPVGRADGGFPWVEEGVAAPIILGDRVPEVVRLAAEDLAEDVERVTGVRPDVLGRRPPGTTAAVELRLLEEPRGMWETYRLSASRETLAVDGSDPRGLAFGIYDLSKRIGVSPWYWWADVPVKKRAELHLGTGTCGVESPAVKYRGIFINDEDWGLEPWASKTFEPEAGNIGPKTYERIFELMLRLRANTLWPAMHPTTVPFHKMEGNAEMADRYAIVLGSSHAEPLLRNNVGEWKESKSLYNYEKNRKGVLDYWEGRVRERRSGESLFTLGMRGIHDSPMVGFRRQNKRIPALERLMEDQRELLARYLGGGDPSRVPQIFCPYKEVLDDYNKGLRVPDDVTIVWPDDNFGYVRRFATAEERRRSGGLGVYYHMSYLGSPLSWIWFDSMPPALIWAEMTRAHEQGARTLWMGNVGDIKGNELSCSYFLDLAWDAGDTSPDHAARFLRRFAADCFGEPHAAAISDIWRRHQALAFARKPEHLQWHFPGGDYRPSELNESEIARRLEDYAGLREDAERVERELSAESRDAYFQLVLYPVSAAAAANERYFRNELAIRYHARGDVDAASGALAASRRGHADAESLTERYNGEISEGKWRHIIRVLGIPHRSWFVKFIPMEELPPVGSDFSSDLTGSGAGDGEELAVKSPEGGTPGDFMEIGGVVSINAGNFTSRSDRKDGFGWHPVPGLGRTGSAVTVLPSEASIPEGTPPRLGYRFHVESGGEAEVVVRLLPTHPIVSGQGLRFEISIDGGQPVRAVVKDGFDTRSSEWKNRVLSNAVHVRIEPRVKLQPGWHDLELVAVDAGVVVDKFVIDLGGLKSSYDGPPETRISDRAGKEAGS